MIFWPCCLPLHLAACLIVTAKHCAHCGKALGTPKLCGLCKQVAYCDSKHQKAHWKQHKKECRRNVQQAQKQPTAAPAV